MTRLCSALKTLLYTTMVWTAPAVAMAARSTGGSLPGTGPLKAFVDFITGPIAIGLITIGLAGGLYRLIFRQESFSELKATFGTQVVAGGILLALGQFTDHLFGSAASIASTSLSLLGHAANSLFG